MLNIFHKIGVSFQHSFLNKKVYKFIKSGIFPRYFSRAIVKKSILQLYRTTVFLVQLWMAAFNNLFNICNKKIRQVKNQIITKHIPEEKLKQLGLRNCYLVLSNSCSRLYLASSKSRMHYSIALTFSPVKLE